MEYGLRRYEALHRLVWFVFFLFCLLAACMARGSENYPTAANVQWKDLKTLRFWTGFRGILLPPPAMEGSRLRLEQEGSTPGAQKPAPPAARSSSPASADPALGQQNPAFLARAMIYLIWAGLIFLAGKLVWLIVQQSGKYALQFVLAKAVKAPPPAVPGQPRPAVPPESLFPRQLLLDKVRRLPFGIIFHPFLRLRLMLTSPRKNVSAEELFEKERRIVDSDWQILYGSWGPVRWLLWILPFLALLETAWLFSLHVQHASATQKELLDTVQSIPNALLPLAQVAGIVLFFKLASGLLGRLEELYLSNLDALIYDRLLSRLPFQSNDTSIILESLQRQFQELHAALRRLERSVVSGKDGGKQQ